MICILSPVVLAIELIHLTCFGLKLQNDFTNDLNGKLLLCEWVDGFLSFSILSPLSLDVVVCLPSHPVCVGGKGQEMGRLGRRGGGGS